jgi:hypothetical protein
MGHFHKNGRQNNATKVVNISATILTTIVMMKTKTFTRPTIRFPKSSMLTAFLLAASRCQNAIFFGLSWDHSGTSGHVRAQLLPSHQIVPSLQCSVIWHLQLIRQWHANECPLPSSSSSSLINPSSSSSDRNPQHQWPCRFKKEYRHLVLKSFNTGGAGLFAMNEW